MNLKSNTLIYPLDINSVSLIRHNNLIDKYKITKAVVPKAWGFTGEDASVIDKGDYLGLIVESDFDEAVKECETVLFVESETKLNFNNMIYPQLIKAVESSKNIVCAIKLEDKVKEEIVNIANKNNSTFEYLIEGNNDIEVPLIEYTDKINVPVIFVAGLCERTNKFEVQLALRENLINMGYKVSQIGTRKYCELMGFHSFPEFMYSKEFYDHEKVTLFNEYVKLIELDENPDIIIIGIPGATIPYNDIFKGRFGILAYEISMAVSADITVLCSLLERCFDKKYFELMSNIHKDRFNSTIDCYNISPAMYNKKYSEYLKSVQYINTSSEYVNKKIEDYKNLKTPIFNVLDKNDGKKMTEFIVNKLVGYAEEESI